MRLVGKYDGLQLSDRVWNLSKYNEELLKDYVDKALITGRSADDLSRDVRELLTEPNRLFRRVRNPKTGKLELSKAAQAYNPRRGMYRSSYMNAKRLARTEINMAYRTSDHERWKSLKFVLGYEVKLSNRHPAPDICNHAAGRYPNEFKFVGWHPQCLCYAVPILPDKKSFLDNLVNGVPLKGEVKDIPDSMKQYISDNITRISAYKKQPFWVQDNFKGGRIENDLSLDDKRAVIVKSFQNGGEVKIYSRVDIASSDFKDVMRCAEFFAKKGERVEILPKIHHKDNLYTQIFGDLVGTKYAGKCPDLKVNGKFYEYEGFTSKNRKNALRNMLKHGHKQSSRLIIDDCGHEIWYYKKRVNDYIRDKNKTVIELWLLKDDGLTRIY